MDKEDVLSGLTRQGYLRSARVISAMRKVPRERFLPDELREVAWMDAPLPIGHGATVSAPHMYAMMMEALELGQGMSVLEVGTGSGYGAALLCELAGKNGSVVTVEIVPELVERAKAALEQAGYGSVLVVKGDGSKGYAEKAPYDRIIVTAYSSDVPDKLVAQLKSGGILLIPVGYGVQELVKIRKTSRGKIERESLGPCVFVPLVTSR